MYEVLTSSDGNVRWYHNGQLHRDDGPAIERADGTKQWYHRGYLHRDDGPAIKYSSGEVAWYIHGTMCSFNRYVTDLKKSPEEITFLALKYLK